MSGKIYLLNQKIPYWWLAVVHWVQVKNVDGLICAGCMCDSSPNLAYNDDEVASYDDEDDQGQQDIDGRLNPVRTGWSTEERYMQLVFV